ncbi:unnamed protein product, partial [Rotaria sp. Silwood1]
MKCKVGSTGGPHRGECVKKSLMMTTNPDMLEECAQIVANARHIVCFTGAEGCGSTLGPDCVLFTESLSSNQWMVAELATRELEPGDVMIIVGTSAQVYPAVGLPELAAQRGDTVTTILPAL